MDDGGARIAAPLPEGDAVTDIVLIIGAGLIGAFYPVLLQGFGVTAWLPCSVKTLLCGQLGLSPAYVEERITTIFLDGKATDRIDEASVGDRSTLALSAAMPGLVGATMRRAGYYAALRSAITHRDAAAETTGRIATVRIKLFNLLLRELGPEFLRRGVLLGGAEAGDFFGTLEEEFWRGCESVFLNGAPVEPLQFGADGVLAGAGTVRLTAIFRDRE